MIDSVQELLIDGRYKETITGSCQLKNKKDKMTVNVQVLSDVEGLKIRIENKNKDKFCLPIIDKKKKGYTRLCDYLILLPNKNGITDVYFIELKKTISDAQSEEFEYACDQILSTVPVWEYLVTMINTHFNEKPRFKLHFAVIAERAASKRDKQITKTNKRYYKHKDKNFTLVYSQQDLLFKQLKCRIPS